MLMIKRNPKRNLKRKMVLYPIEAIFAVAECKSVHNTIGIGNDDE